MSEENMELVKAIFAAWEARDPQAALARMDPQVEVDMTGVSFPGIAGVDRGHDGLQRTITTWLEAWGSLEFFPKSFIDAGDHVIVWLRMAGEGRGSGVPTEVSAASVYTIRNGLVVSWRAFDTLAAAASSVGV
jgi:ketosteroid isomerase-like protein